MTIKVNAMGDGCPIPVVKTQKAMQELGGTGTVETLVDNETAVQNLGKLAASKGCTSKTEKLGENEYRVTITVAPDKGYELDSLTVKDVSGNKLKLTDKGNGKYTFTMPGSKVTVSAEFVEEQAASIFADVPADAYYAKAVEWAVKKGITNGKANGKACCQKISQPGLIRC